MKTNYDLLTDDQKRAMLITPWGIDEGSNEPLLGCCNGSGCKKCLFKGNRSCYASREEWLNQPVIEYQIPKDTPIDTKVLVSNGGDYWNKRYFAGKFSEDGKARCFDSGSTSRSNTNGNTFTWVYCRLA